MMEMAEAQLEEMEKKHSSQSSGGGKVEKANNLPVATTTPPIVTEVVPSAYPTAASPMLPQSDVLPTPSPKTEEELEEPRVPTNRIQFLDIDDDDSTPDPTHFPTHAPHSSHPTMAPTNRKILDTDDDGDAKGLLKAFEALTATRAPTRSSTTSPTTATVLEAFDVHNLIEKVAAALIRKGKTPDTTTTTTTTSSFYSPPSAVETITSSAVVKSSAGSGHSGHSKTPNEAPPAHLLPGIMPKPIMTERWGEGKGMKIDYDNDDAL